MTWQEPFKKDGEWFWAMLQTGILVVSSILVVRQLRLQRMATMATTLQSLDERWHSDAMLTARSSVCSNFGKGEAFINRPEEYVCSFFEDIGMYVRKGILPLDVAWSSYSHYAEHYWAMLKSHVLKFRGDSNDITYYEEFELLARKFDRYGMLRRLSHLRFRRPDLNIPSFVDGEMQDLNYYKETHQSRAAAPSA